MDYAIGDLHGCYDALQLLLEKLDFNEHSDRLWFTGDFVNRGPDPLSVLRFVSGLKIKPKVVLGNHDLHFLAVYHGAKQRHPQFDAFDDLLNAPDIAYLVKWLLDQKLAIYDKQLNFLLTHAGICPKWDIQKTLSHANEIEITLADPTLRVVFFREMYGDQPNLWCESLKGNQRLRLITNYLTRMRYLHKGTHALLLQHKTTSKENNALPWFKLVNTKKLGCYLMFGHWAALKGNVSVPGVYGLDTGCYYDGTLTAMCLQTKKITQVVHPL